MNLCNKYSYLLYISYDNIVLPRPGRSGRSSAGDASDTEYLLAFLSTSTKVELGENIKRVDP